MKHDELLAKFNDLFPWEDKGYALRAVVELHHEHTSGSGDIYCYNCQQKYPCLTIQAIEKELS
jgi:hypothetical protein